VPEMRLEAMDVTFDGRSPGLPARGTTANADLSVSPGQTVRVSVRARSNLNADVNAQTAIACVGDGPGLVSLGEATAKDGLFTCAFEASLEAGQVGHATVTGIAGDAEDTVRVALRGTPPAGSFVNVGHEFSPGEQIWSPDRSAVFTWENNGELTVRQEGRVTWRVDTATPSGAEARLRLQTDGNLVLMNDGAARWASSVVNSLISQMAMRDDGALVLMAGDGSVYWRLDPTEILGEGVVGNELTAIGGRPDPKQNAPVVESWQWYRDSQTIDGATAQRYTPTAADVGKKLSVEARVEWPQHYTSFARSPEISVRADFGTYNPILPSEFYTGILTQLGPRAEWDTASQIGTAVNEWGVNSFRAELPWALMADTNGTLGGSAGGQVGGIGDSRWELEGRMDLWNSVSAAADALQTLGYGHDRWIDGFPSDQTEREKFRDYVEYVLDAYPGKRAGVELWNEWDTYLGYVNGPSGLTSNTPCPYDSSQGPGCPESYAALAKEIEPLVHEQAPAVPFIVGAVSGTDVEFVTSTLSTMRELGVRVDGVSLHPYAYLDSVNSGQNRPRDIDQAVEWFADRVEAAYGQRLPIYVSEVGWSTCSDSSLPQCLAEDTVARYLVESYVRLRALPEVQGVWWNGLRDAGTDPLAPEDRLGLLRRDGTPKPSAQALATLAGFWKECTEQSARPGSWNQDSIAYTLTCPGGNRQIAINAPADFAVPANFQAVNLVTGELSTGPALPSTWGEAPHVGLMPVATTPGPASSLRSFADVSGTAGQLANHDAPGVDAAAWGRQTVTVTLRDDSGRAVTDGAAALTVAAATNDPRGGAGLYFANGGAFACAGPTDEGLCLDGVYGIEVYASLAGGRLVTVRHGSGTPAGFVLANGEDGPSAPLTASFAAPPASAADSVLAVTPVGTDGEPEALEVGDTDGYVASVVVWDAGANNTVGGQAIRFTLEGEECAAWFVVP
ncbi:MAG: hypothetical protein LBJ08_12345, partial [Bifidobacteriaceae bacterium]|nr:hypothetical protein [Bifidobacteriaceae bacterium]